MKTLLLKSMDNLPEHITVHAISHFLHTEMKPYEDSLEDTTRGVTDALSGRPAPGGFILCVLGPDNLLAGVLVMLNTGMKGYVPEHQLLFLAVKRECRGIGIGRQLINKAIPHCNGDIKLHVEKNNSALKLYELCGFQPKYIDMRLTGRGDKNE